MILRSLRGFALAGIAGLALSGCFTGGATGGPAVPGVPTGINAVSDPSITAAAADKGPTEVMGPTSDHSDAQGDEMAKLTELQKSYPSLDLPDRLHAFVGPQIPNTQTPVENPQPQAVWQNECWEEPITLTVQALYWVKSSAGEYLYLRHEDLKAGPTMRFVVSDPSTLPNNEFDWTAATFWDVPLTAETKDGLVSNVTTVVRSFKDRDILVFIYYKPPQDASSATDYTPTPFPDPANCDPNFNICLKESFDSQEEWDGFVTNPNVLSLGRFVMDIDENHGPCTTRLARQSLTQNPSSGAPGGMIYILPSETQPSLPETLPSLPQTPSAPTEPDPSIKDLIRRPPARIITR